MSQDQGPSRAQVDWFTNPTFDQAMSWIDAQLDKEIATLRAAGRGESEIKFNHQTGVCDGIERMRLLLSNRRQHTLHRIQTDGSDEPEATP